MDANLTPSWTIRPATTEDVAELARLNVFIQAQHVTAHPEVFRRPNEADSSVWFRTLVSEPANRFWLAHAHGNAVGYAWARLEQRPETVLTQRVARIYLHRICVEPTARGHGIGGALLDVVMQYAAEQDVREVALDTWAFNVSAQRFFARHGFGVYRYQL